MRNKTLMKTLSALLAVVMVLCSAPLSGFVGLKFPEIKLPEWNLFDFSVLAEAKAYSGTCGENITWTLDSETGVLDITGTGDMYDSWDQESVPWAVYRLLIKTINISDGVTSIGNWAFYDCTKLETVNIPGSVINIMYYAFYNCLSLSSIIIPDGVVNIYDFAFGNTNLTTITLPSSVAWIDWNVFENSKLLSEIIVDDNNENYCNDEYGVLYDKAKLNLVKCPEGFNVVCYKIPDGVECIYTSAFARCTNIEKIEIPSTVISIGYGAFRYCTSLISITIPDGVTSVGSYVFEGCTKLKDLTMPVSLDWDRYDNFFYECRNIEKVTLTKGTGRMPDYSEEYSYYNDDYKYMYTPWYTSRDVIKEIIIEDGITNIGNYAFRSCTNLKSIEIPNTVANIGRYAFGNCINLTSITLNSGITKIDSPAFYNCTSLENVNYTGSMASWCAISFGGSSSNPLYFAENFYINNVLQTDIVIPDSIVEIKDYAFYGYDGLKSVTFSDEIISINDYAFNGCSNLTTVTLPDSIMKIGEYAFGGCSALSTVYYDGTTEEWQYKEIGIGNNNLTKNILFANDSDRPYYTGGCGENLKWTLYTDGELVISGNGDMSDYSENSAPWYEKLYEIKKVTIKEGVTRVGNFAFNGLVNLEEVTIADSVTSIGNSAFRNCVALDDVVIPNSIKTIGYNAFEGCSSLSIIELSDGLEVISGFVFSNCTSLSEITLPETVTSIGECAFQNCTGLTEIIIPDSVTLMNWSALSGCTAIKKVVIGNGIKSIADSAFSGCTSLEQVIISEGITSIGYRAFYNCSSLIFVDLPDSVTNIGQYAFSGCTSLGSVKIPEGITGISNYTFYNCSALTSVNIPDGVRSIGSYAFYNCSNLILITIPDTVTSIGNYAFDGCNSLKYVGYSGKSTDWNYISFYSYNTPIRNARRFYETNTLDVKTINGVDYCVTDNEAIVLSYSGDASQVTILEKVDNKNVVEISAEAFKDNTSITNITIPNTVTFIGSYAFANCSNIKSIVIPDSVTEIGSCVFAGMTALEELTVPFVGRYKTPSGNYRQRNLGWFFNYYSYYSAPENAVHQYNYYYDIPVTLKKVTITSAEVVSGYTFCNCWFIEEISINDSAAGIGKYAFYGCTNLKKVNIPEASPVLGQYAFYKCENLSEIVLNDTIETIGRYAFAYCTNLKSITIPDSVTKINGDILYGATRLESLTIPFIGETQNSEAELRYYVFDYRIPETLKTVNITNETAIVKKTFADSKIETITLNEGIKTIGVRAFANCTELKAITIPDSVENIQDSAFYNCSSMKTVDLGNNTNMSMDYDVFNGCNGIEGFTIGNNNVNYCTDAKGVLYNKNKTGLIRYPAASSMKEYTIASTTAYINEFAFENSYNLEKVNFPENMMSIGAYAFRNCTALEEVYIPDGANTICHYAFNGCASVKKVTLPESLIILGRYAFGDCVNLSEVIINCANLEDANSQPFYRCGIETDGLRVVFTDNVKTIPAEIFSDWYYGESNVKEITIGKNVASVGTNAFCGNANLIVLDFNAVDCAFEDSAFSSCSSLTDINIGSNVKRIPEYFVNYCNALTEVTIPESVTEIGKYAFSNCENLESVVFLGKNKIEIGDNIFDYSPKATICCKENSYMHYYADMNVIRYCIIDEENNPNYEIKNEVLISYKGNAENIYLNSVNRIGFGAFSENTALKHIELSSGIDRIYDMAFDGCTNLATVIIPKSVTSIGENAFDGCDKLTIYCYAGSYAETYAKEQGINYKHITLDLTETEVEIYSDEVFNLGTSYNIDMVDSEEILWTSGDESVVKIADDGKIIAVGSGTAIITAKTESGLEAECKVTVNSGKRPAVEDVIASDFVVSYKGTTKIEPNVEFIGGVDYTVEYVSSNEFVATVDKDGNVTATGTGEAEILVTVTDEYGNVVEDTCTVTVSYAWWQWLIIIFLFGWIWY